MLVTGYLCMNTCIYLFGLGKIKGAVEINSRDLYFLGLDEIGFSLCSPVMALSGLRVDALVVQVCEYMKYCF